MKRFLIVLGLVTAATPGNLLASLTETFTHTTSQSAVPFTDSFTLPAFDTSLGTLKSVELTLTNNSVADVRIFNFSSSTLPFSDASETVGLTISGGGLSSTVTVKAGPFSGVATPGLNSFSGLTNSDSKSVTITSGLAGFENPPNGVNLSFSAVSTVGNYTGTGDSNLFFSGSAVEGGVTTLVYSYDTTSAATPEPAMFGVLAAGLIGLGFSARKRLRSSVG